MTAKKLRHFLLKLFSILAFVGVSGTALFLAYGYQPDFSFRHIKKTSIVHITPHYNQVEVLLDGKLLAEELPFQIKGILPGIYQLQVNSSLFLPWKSELKVENDFVTKVDDVLLFPKDLGPLVKTVNTFLKDTEFYWSKNSFISKKKGQDSITLISFFPDGTLRQQEVKISGSEIKYVDFLPDQNFLLHFRDTKSSEVVFTRSGTALSLSLPEKIEQPVFDHDENNLFFIWQKDLWKMSRSDLENFLTDPAHLTSQSTLDLSQKGVLPLLKKIDHFSLADNGLYFLQDGQIFFTDFEAKNTRLIDSTKDTTNLSYRAGKGRGFLVLRKGEKRFLYALMPDENRLLFSTSLNGDFLTDDFDNVIFVNDAGQLYFYDAEKSEKILMHEFAGTTKKSPEIELISWLNDYHQFLFTEDGVFTVSDVPFLNVYPLPSFPKDGKVYVKSKTFYFMDGLNLRSLLLP